MSHPTSLPAAPTPTTVLRTIVCSALVFAGAAKAQSMDTALPATTPDPYAQSMYGGAVVQRPSTRSVFIGTLAALLAQGVGNALSQGLGGSITKWFGGDAKADAMVASPSMSTPAKSTPAKREREAPAALQAGLAYEVHLIGSDGATRAVDPARHVFHTGDRFQVYYRPTLPGRVDVTNVDPRGNESRIDNVEVAAGQLAALGPYRFVEAKGRETLKLVLQPCSSPVLTAATRAIVKAGASSATANAPLRIGECGDTKTRAVHAKTRTITKTTMDGSTAFALDALSADELKSGRVGSREVLISLQHR